MSNRLKIFVEEVRVGEDVLPELKSLAGKLGFIIALLYVVRNSIIQLSPIPLGFWAPACLAIIFVCCAFQLGGASTRFNLTIFLLAGMTAVGAILSVESSIALQKWAAWSALVLAVAGGSMSRMASRLRESAWRTNRILFMVIGVTSAGWFILRLPVLGRGAFTGVMMHSMLVGPIAGIATVFALNQALKRRKLMWVAICLLSVIPCLASGSRIAVISTGVSLLVLILARFSLKSLFILIIPIILGLGIFVSFPDEKRQLDQDFSSETEEAGFLQSMTSELSHKSLSNSREELWAARLQEFHEHPLYGIGVGTDLAAGEVSSEGGRFVEPGSSYLALLSMSGILGAGAFLAVVIQLLFRLSLAGVFIQKDILGELLAIFIFLLVHGIGEGWLLAVGNALCFLFWLCVGRLFDLTELRSPTSANPRSLVGRAANSGA